MTTPFLPGMVALPRRVDDGVAKRARDGDLTFLEEADARGWSSAMSERSLALRRRRYPASIFPRRSSSWVAVATAAKAEEYGCRREEAAAPNLIGVGAAAEEAALVEPSCFACFWFPDPLAFDAPSMAASFMLATEPLLPPRVVVLEAGNEAAAGAAADEHGSPREVPATPDAVGAESAAEEADPYLSYYFLTL